MTTLYLPRAFRVDDREALERFVALNAFGTLVTAGPGGVAASHVPLLPTHDAEGRLVLQGHVAKANPHWQEFEPAGEVLAIFQGPHAYVSPGWYANHPSVPTWNYAVVHATGRARVLPETEVPGLLDRLSRTYEAGRAQPWQLAMLPPHDAAMRFAGVVAFEITVERLVGKFKLSQNRRREDVEGVTAGLEAQGERALAALMREAAEAGGESR